MSRQARQQIDKISAWWSDNRLSSLSLFVDELDKIDRVLRAHPELGIVYATRARSGNVRRILLGESGYHLYYRYEVDPGEIVVLAVHGASRGRRPRF